MATIVGSAELLKIIIAKSNLKSNICTPEIGVNAHPTCNKRSNLKASSSLEVLISIFHFYISFTDFMTFDFIHPRSTTQVLVCPQISSGSYYFHGLG